MADEVRITVIATGFEQTRVTTRRPSTTRDRRSNQAAAPARPAPRPAQQPAEVPVQDDEAEAPAQPAPRKVEDEFTSRVYDTDDLDIPAFLRRR
jgi:cell division protein FtsZ